MRKISVWLTILLFTTILGAKNSILMNEWLMSSPQAIYLPAFSKTGDIKGKIFKFSDLLKTTKVNFFKKSLKFKKIKIGKDGTFPTKIKKNSLLLLKNYISVHHWTKGALSLRSNAFYQVYLDGRLIKTKVNVGQSGNSIPVKLNAGKHEVFVKLLTADKALKFTADFEYDKKFKDSKIEMSLNPIAWLTINDILEGNRINSASISPTGRYVLINCTRIHVKSGKSTGYLKIYDLKKKRNVAFYRNKSIPGMKWLPRTDRLSYTTNREEETDIFLYDLNTGIERKVARGLRDFSGYTWSPNEEFIIFSRYKSSGKKLSLKRIFGVEDRLPYFRGRSYLHKIDLKSGQVIQLTAGNLSANLHDIRGDGEKILFSTSRMDYKKVPFSKQSLYEMDVKTLELTTIWKDKLYSGFGQYSPDGSKLLVSGGPECFGLLGVKVSKGRIPNSYDGQLYLFDLKSRKPETLTRDFNPAVSFAYWSRDGNIYLKAEEKDYVNLYRLKLRSKKFFKIKLRVDVLDGIDFAYFKSQAVYNGTSIKSPDKLFALDLNRGISTLLYFPKYEQFEKIRLGKTEDWNFVNKKGDTIYGRIYFPPGYEKDKKYPVIVNYYGGTAPIERSFGGRYPINIWAAGGYIVYVLQPSGATGFGQDFSALHVNGWGADPIDDIIDGTKQFLKDHPQADAENVGCIGASYGGYTTMLLQTRTNIFKTGIAHAGISSITSYWGEGYWGYSYSTCATKFSYPWNRKDIYVNNSPVYNADKFNNSILLLHGTVDTNVPVGESLQYYAALKLLGKDVEMVLVEGQNHWILDYKKRIQWHHTIMSWFDKKLKNRPEQWDDLYPSQNL
jgi:dipeptidyl aminopeptidase/acylaminoacyl peptidase